MHFVLKLLENADWALLPDVAALETLVAESCREMTIEAVATRTPKGPFPALLETRHSLLDAMLLLGRSLARALQPASLLLLNWLRDK